MSTEQVLVFPANRLEPYESHFVNSVITDPFLVEDMLDDLLYPGVAGFMDRDKAEVDPSFKQVIPYCVLSMPLKDKTTYFAYKRTKKGGEGRLHEKWSVGVGGHINPCDTEGASGWDGNFYGPYAAALRRELVEEVSIVLGSDLSEDAPVVGVLYDPSDDVGKVHFGVVHLVKLAEGTKIESSDPALASGLFLLPEALFGHDHLLDCFENWSRLVIKHMLPPWSTQ